jgi:thioredoxin 1
MSGKVMELSEKDFDEFVGRNSRVVVDFWAAWCGPCKAMGPVFDRLSEKHSGKVAFGKVDCDKNPGLVKRFKVMAIPTLILLKDGEYAADLVGLLPDNEIDEKIGEVLLS